MPRFQHLWERKRQRSLLLLPFFLLIASCSFGGSAATPEAVNLPVYQPGTVTTTVTSALTETVSAEATTGATSPATPVSADRPTPPTVAAAAQVESTEATSATEQALVAEPPSERATTAPAEAAAAPVAAEASGPLQLIGYAAEIVAEEEVVIVAEVSGQVMEVLADVGDPVEAGDILVRVDGAVLEAQRAQALAGLRAANAQLAGLRNPADEEDLVAARASVAAARAAYNRAAGGPTDEERRQLLAQLQQAQAAVAVAQAGYNLVRYLPEVGALPQGLQLQAATLAYEAAQAQYDKFIQGATPDLVAGAYAQLVSAQTQLQRLEEGVDEAQIRAGEAQVRAAENALYLAQLQLEKTTIVAPMAGVVAQVQTSAGSLAAPGIPLLTLLSPTVQVKIAVEETQLGALQVGQQALVRVAAYPERTFPGAVVIIAPELNPATRTVEVTIQPEDPDGLLAPGMTAQVDLLAK